VTIVIFGGGGDLAHRKLLPALYNLQVDGLLPHDVAIVGVGRKEMSDDAYREFAKDGITRFSRRPIDEKAWQSFAATLYSATASIDGETSLAPLGARLDVIEHERNLKAERVYYLALPSSLFVPTVRQLQKARFVSRNNGARTRIVVEKPIGTDLKSACAINDAIAEVFDEQQIYRIDHYLGKETVQNILVMRFANSIFEPLFNQRFVDHVQITVAEEEGVGTRAGYYEQAGALRDMVQNHMLQLLSLVAMEAPHSLNADVIRDEKLEILQSLRPLRDADIDANVIRAQYAGYTTEPGVDPRSRTETYVALQIFIDNWRWYGVPFLLRTGKRLPKRSSEISIYLKEIPPILFNANPAKRLEPNVLAIRIQPDEGFSLGISCKHPGPHVDILPVKMDFHYGELFGASSPEAYERLLLDVLAGDPTLFMRRDAVETAWRWVMPVLDRWAEQTKPLPTYVPGSWGPAEGDRLIESIGRNWRPI
jgi:glucose-6-phosphate 1-dehydrogenase